jgi:hypothetical protein
LIAAAQSLPCPGASTGERAEEVVHVARIGADELSRLAISTNEPFVPLNFPGSALCLLDTIAGRSEGAPLPCRHRPAQGSATEHPRCLLALTVGYCARKQEHRQANKNRPLWYGHQNTPVIHFQY